MKNRCDYRNRNLRTAFTIDIPLLLYPGAQGGGGGGGGGVGEGGGSETKG